MKLDYLFRAAAIACVLIAGSCSVTDDGNLMSEDGAKNHPIAVEPSFRELKVQFQGGADGMNAEDTAKFQEQYRIVVNELSGASVISQVIVQDKTGATEKSPVAEKMLGLLLNQLK